MQLTATTPLPEQNINVAAGRRIRTELPCQLTTRVFDRHVNANLRSSFMDRLQPMANDFAKIQSVATNLAHSKEKRNALIDWHRVERRPGTSWKCSHEGLIPSCAHNEAQQKGVGSNVKRAVGSVFLDIFDTPYVSDNTLGGTPIFRTEFRSAGLKCWRTRKI